MSGESEAVHDAEIALAKVRASHGEPKPVEPVKPSATRGTSSFLGHVNEPAVKGKDFT